MSNFTLFFCSSKDIKHYSETIPNPKVGCTTAGEIMGGFMSGLASQEFSSTDFNVEVVKIPNINIPITRTAEIVTAANKVIADKKNLICLVLHDGLSGKEEIVQTTLSKVLPANTLIIGGSSGDGSDFKDTYCCIDNDVFKGATVVLLGTNLKYHVVKENIYKSSNKYTIVTKTDGRRILELDKIPASKRYAELLNVSPDDLDNLSKQSFIHPFGTCLYEETFIGSPQSFGDDYSVLLYKTIVPSTVLWVLDPINYKEEIIKTTDEILKHGTPIFTLTINCILRKLLFDQENSCEYINKYLKKINAVGFTSYGEQLGCNHLNQTMVTLSFYK